MGRLNIFFIQKEDSKKDRGAIRIINKNRAVLVLPLYPEKVRQTKFITVIILKDSINDANTLEIERLTHLNSIKTFAG